MKYTDLLESAAIAVKNIPQYKKQFKETGAWQMRGLNLNSWEGCPATCKGNIYASDNQFTSFDHFPKMVGGSLIVDGNKADIHNLQGIGKVTAGISISNSNLHSLVGLNELNDEMMFLNVKGNKLTSLVGGPSKVRAHYVCDKNPITSWEGAPKFVGNYVLISGTSMAGFGDHFHEIHGKLFINDALPTNMLSIFKIVGLKGVEIEDGIKDSKLVMDILNDNLPLGPKGATKAQMALMKAKLFNQAKV
jgi:hypothetical protein